MVSFLSQAQSAAEFQKRGFDDAGLIVRSNRATRLKWSAYTYQSRVQNAEAIVTALTTHLGAFANCLAWVCRRALGDFSGEDINNPDWSEYETWRARHGARGGLAELPGHRFRTGEAGELREFIRSALYLGWDTMLKSDATKTIIKLSHDDRIELYYMSSPVELKNELSELCKIASWFDPAPKSSRS